MKLKGRNGIFYGWYIVLAGFIIMGVNVGIVSNCGSQFIKPIAEELGYTRAEVGMMQTIMSICSGESLSAGMYSYFSPPASRKNSRFCTAISSSVSRQSAEKPGDIT